MFEITVSISALNGPMLTAVHKSSQQLRLTRRHDSYDGAHSRTFGRHRAFLDVAARELRVRHRNARPSRGRDHAGALAEVAVVRKQDEEGREVRPHR